jgi:hypothetical protein
MKKRLFIAPCALALALVLLASALVPWGAATGNTAPLAENLEFVTYRGVSVGGNLSAYDPEGDLLTFEITTPPTKGEIELEDNGRFVYTPADGKKGRDYFGYKAVDSEGNCSQEATVIVKIMKQKTKVTYSDMEGNGAHYAALRLAEDGVYVGECLGGNYVFDPTESVSRGDFLTMCMKIADMDVLSGVTSTGFADDDQIPAWVKPYVSTALMNGLVSGYASSGTAVFDAASPVSYSEAAVMLNNVLGITDVVSVWADIDEEAVPTWAYQATANLSSCDMMPAGISSMADSLTRAEAAQMLASAMAVIEDR